LFRQYTNQLVVNAAQYAGHIHDNWQFSPRALEICYANEDNLSSILRSPPLHNILSSHLETRAYKEVAQYCLAGTSLRA